MVSDRLHDLDASHNERQIGLKASPLMITLLCLQPVFLSLTSTFSISNLKAISFEDTFLPAAADAMSWSAKDCMYIHLQSDS